jgi:WD40 repeat protein
MSADRNIILWDLATGEEIRRFGSDLIFGPDALSATFNPDGHYILSNNGARPGLYPDQEPNLILWDVDTGEPVRILRGHEAGGVGGVAISADGHKALSGAWLGEMILWDLQTGEVLQRFMKTATGAKCQAMSHSARMGAPGILKAWMEFW